MIFKAFMYLLPYPTIEGFSDGFDLSKAGHNCDTTFQSNLQIRDLCFINISKYKTPLNKNK